VGKGGESARPVAQLVLAFLPVIWRQLPLHSRTSVVLHTAVWLLVWGAVSSTVAWAANGFYVVKRGDTIHSIARKFDIPPSELAERNGLSHNFHVYAGQRLILPGVAPASALGSANRAAGKVSLPHSIQRAIDKAPVRPGRWQYIVIHHSDVDTGTVKAMDKYHREVRHMENGLAYHFVIGNGSGMGDGEIAACRRWLEQLDGGHLASEGQNKVAIGICLVGNFDQHPPTSREMQSLRALVQSLMVRCKLTPRAVKTHQQINIVRTRCPGAKFPTSSFLDSLQAPCQ
jgi:LysM repeat protein